MPARRVRQGDELTKAEYDSRVARRMPGETFLKQVRTACEQLGYWVAHIPRYVIKCSRCGQPNFRPTREGVPDLLIARRNPARFLLREIKGVHEKPTEMQEWVIEAARESGVDAGIWRPNDDYLKELILP